MENASKALIMAAEILVGVLIISIAVYLIMTMGEYSANTTSRLEDAQITQFNQQFLQYYGTTAIQGEEPHPIECTIHEIVGVANLAQKINTQYGFEEVEEISDDSYYIQIDLKIGHKVFEHIEAMSQEELINLVKNNSIYYTQEADQTKANTQYFMCEEIGYAEHTRLVNYMKFVEI